MNYLLQPSLERFSLIRIAVALWEQSDIRTLIANSGILLDPHQEKELWQDIEDMVMVNVSQLPQPELLKQKILRFIKPIGLEILKWIKYHQEKDYSLDFPNGFHWTPYGTIDKQKTVKALIREEKLDVKARYNLACIYCLEDDIQELWNILPENHRCIFHNTENEMKVVMQKDLVYLWVNNFYETTNNFYNCRFQPTSFSYANAFVLGITYGNKAAAEYFLPKLTSDDRSDILPRAATIVAKRCCKYCSSNIDPCQQYSMELLCFLFSQLKEERQMKIFKNNSYGVLKCFLDWPLQNNFIKNASIMLNFLSEKDYLSLLELITDKVISGYKDYDYQNLFCEFWKLGPKSYKRYILGECASGYLLPKLFRTKDKQYIELVFQEASVILKTCFIFDRRGIDICKNLIYDNEWYLLKYFITECISSKSEMIKLKKLFEKCITNNDFVKMKGKWGKFFHFLNDLLCEFDKCIPGDDTSKAN